MNDKTKVRRVPKRGKYDTQTIHKILDSSYYCHVGFIHEGYPVVIPTAYGRAGNFIYIHGSTASRMIKNIKQGVEVCVTISRMKGFVLAKSLFHHSMNYESVVIFGKAELVESVDEKLEALKRFTEHIIPGRWNEARLPSDQELKGTSILKLSTLQASAKIRDEGVKDDPADEHLDVWAGVIPIYESLDNPTMTNQKDLPDSVKALYRAETS